MADDVIEVSDLEVATEIARRWLAGEAIPRHLSGRFRLQPGSAESAVYAVRSEMRAARERAVRPAPAPSVFERIDNALDPELAGLVR